MNMHVSAPAPTGRPASRRGFLRALAAVPIAGAATAAPLLGAAAAIPVPEENPELLARWQSLEEAERAFVAAIERHKAARERFDELCPPLPDEMVLKPRDFETLGLRGDPERDVDGKICYPPGKVRYRIIAGSKQLREAWQLHDGRTRAGREIRRRLKVAEEYEAAVERARERSGIEAAQDDCYCAGIEVEKLAGAIAETEARTLRGILIKARAIQACARAASRCSGYYGGRGALELAAAVVAVMEAHHG